MKKTIKKSTSIFVGIIGVILTVVACGKDDPQEENPNKRLVMTKSYYKDIPTDVDVMRYKYDAKGRVISMIYSDGTVGYEIDFIYNDAGNVDKIKLMRGYRNFDFTFTYNNDDIPMKMVVTGDESYESSISFSDDVLRFIASSGFSLDIVSPDFATGMFSKFDRSTLTYDHNLKNGFPDGNNIGIPLAITMEHSFIAQIQLYGMVYSQKVPASIENENGNILVFQYEKDKHNYIIKRSLEDSRGSERIAEYFYE
ncbi:hypothetical protein FXV77_10735 [Sphingobacterium phlebotomi]|uniref:DUF4595 domain-containing protein n=1 Tax=Sphingobacterium phlebotomi TaxID=2605433 RepID=A0A5D4H5N4_9SPHI|nr:hypothetical protein [Sphingobacterium phlebotomi]TYR35917.1 hypothetical protein FXV77_10735 [Sphingobacterium phlebotomi]